MTGDHGPFTHSLEAWLDTEDEFLDADGVLQRALEQVETKPQRRADSWPDWRSAVMNKTLMFAAAAAAVVVVAAIGFGALGGFGSTGLGGPAPSTEPSVVQPTATAEPTPSPSAEAGLDAGPYLITGEDGAMDGGPVEITVDIASTGWFPYVEVDGVLKGPDDGRDPPEGVGGLLLGWVWPVGTGFHVYADPCNWTTSVPERPATTPEEIAAAFATQALTDPTAPVDVTVGGYAGMAVTLHTPMSFYIDEDAPREEEFAECDEDTFAVYGIEGDGDADTEGVRNAQGPGQIDELWILDVDGAIVILDAAYSPATPLEVVEEIRTLAQSATFEAP